MISDQLLSLRVVRHITTEVIQSMQLNGLGVLTAKPFKFINALQVRAGLLALQLLNFRPVAELNPMFHTFGNMKS